ncbi:hypothetical protein [Rhodopseudomonas sp. B29]|uniref:hypothetical protein n=1 Tax=Rhodopseudomonas sp. B29 TaxID=95607 RepID=UPI0003B75827|nr:hypothetical protein [Rhodopseudomonas sp. B29]
MNWVRTNVWLGARLALIALALQFAAAFGHFHPLALSTPAQITVASAPSQPDTDHHHEGIADFCAICAVVAMAGSMLAASPPMLPLQQATPLQLHLPAADALHARAAVAAFQPRGPPLS